MTHPDHQPADGVVAVPAPDALVLLNRPLHPQPRRTQPSRFADDRWYLIDAILEDHSPTISLNLGSVREPFRHTIKHLTWLELNYTGDDVLAVPGRTARRPAILTIARSFRFKRAFTDWLIHRGRACLAEVTSDDLDDYLVHVKHSEVSRGQREELLTAVRRIWAYRTLLHQPERLPPSPPWGVERIDRLLQHRREPNSIRTPRIPPDTMSALLAWSLRFVEDFADDILTAAEQGRRMISAAGESERAEPRPPGRLPGQLGPAIEQFIARCHELGHPLPGRRDNTDALVVNQSHLARLLNTVPEALNAQHQARIAASGLPIVDGTPVLTPITATLGGRPWHAGFLLYEEIPALVRHLMAAAFVVIAYLSGMRPGEALCLQRGCLERSNGLILLRSKEWKGVTDPTGAKRPEGQIRPDPWVVAEPVATAVTVLERLHDHRLLFPNSLHPSAGRRQADRTGRARNTAAITRDIMNLITWANHYCAKHDRADSIPIDPVHAQITPRRLRRTLAWFITRKPRGLVAAAIQYGHVQVQMTLGYAGTYASGFPDDLAFEDWLHRLDTLTEAHHQLAAGEHISGPAADTYRHRLQHGIRFAGRVVRTARETRTLLANPDLNIFPGHGMTCVLDPQRAAGKLATDDRSQHRTPDLDDCRPTCVNIARTDRDIEVIREQVAQLRQLLDDPLAPPIRHAREQHELDRLQRILTDHENTRHTTS